jgi:hypothetical protein
LNILLTVLWRCQGETKLLHTSSLASSLSEVFKDIFDLLCGVPRCLQWYTAEDLGAYPLLPLFRLVLDMFLIFVFFV